MCSKRLRGLGIMNTRKLNEATLMKWIWRLYGDREGDLVSEVLKTKYLRRTSLANCKGTYGSQLWKGLQKVKEKFEWGAIVKVNNGKKTKF